MKILVIDTSADGVPFAIHAGRAGHDVRVYQPPRTTGEQILAGKGLINRVREWKPLMKWADFTLLTSNHMYADDLEPFFQKGFPIIGANRRAAALELDRGLGDDLLTRLGVPTIDREDFDSLDEAMVYVEKNPQSYVCKSWGGTEDKSLSFVSSSPADMIFRMQQWKRTGKVKGKVMLQKKVKGVEMAVAAWFGPGGFSAPICESFEEKKFLNDGLGENTGEMGTVLRYVNKSKLFDAVLKPCEEYLHGTGYVGNVDVNCIIDKAGTPWPLEFTMRLGWPQFNLQMSLHQGDPAEWMGALLEGKDTLRVSNKISVGVVMVHGDFPRCKDPPDCVAGFPISGITHAMEKYLWPQWVMIDRAPHMDGGKVVDGPTLCTAGPIPFAAVTGTGETVCDARGAAYARAWAIDWPSNRMFRTDIGCRLEDQLTSIQLHGFAKGMRYE